MTDSTLETPELHQRFLDDLGDAVLNSSPLSEKPLELEFAPPLPSRVRAYIYNLTSPPGGRPADEHKIQLIAPGQRRDERGNFDLSEDAFVVLVGFSPDEGVYVFWDAYLHHDFSFSANAQVKGETVDLARAEGLATQERQLRAVDELERVVVVPAENLVDGLLERARTASRASGGPGVSRPMGIPYRPPPTRAGTSKKRVFEVDPDLFDRATDAHTETQNALRDRVLEAGLEPLSPSPADPHFDIAWVVGDQAWLAEVKSLTNQNEVRQIRYAIGQVLSYRWFLEWEVSSITPVIALERAPSDERWVDLCAEVGVLLVWPETFDQLLFT